MDPLLPQQSLDNNFEKLRMNVENERSSTNLDEKEIIAVFPQDDTRRSVELGSFFQNLIARPRPWLVIIGLILLFFTLFNIALLYISIRSILISKAHQVNYTSRKPSLNAAGLRLGPNGLLAECGSYPSDAIANGCLFDIMAFQWVPPACWDQDMLDDATSPRSFLAPTMAGTWPWYRWHNRTSPVPQDPEELQQYDYIWTTEDWHKAHCLYSWRTLVKAVSRVLAGEEGVYVLKSATSSSHINHCNLLITDKPAAGEAPLRAFRSIGSCVRLDGPDTILGQLFKD